MSLDTFDRIASRYSKVVYTKKRNDLIETISTSLSPLFISQVRNLHKKAIESFKKELHTRLKADSYDFSNVVKESSQFHIETFTNQAKDICLSDTDWSFDETLSQLNVDMELISSECRSEELSKLLSQTERHIQKELGEFVEVCLNQPSPEMWDKVLERLNGLTDSSKVTFTTKAKSMFLF